MTRKLEDEETIRDALAYCHGVARLVLLQSLECTSNMGNWFSVDGSVHLP
jgi:hypothetical protein